MGDLLFYNPPLNSYIEESTPKIKSNHTPLTGMALPRVEKDVETKRVRSVNTKEKSDKHSNVETIPIIKYGQIVPTTWEKFIKSKSYTSLATIILGPGKKFSISSWINKVTLPKFSNMFKYLPNLEFSSSIKEILP